MRTGASAGSLPGVGTDPVEVVLDVRHAGSQEEPPVVVVDGAAPAEGGAPAAVRGEEPARPDDRGGYVYRPDLTDQYFAVHELPEAWIKKNYSK